MCGSSLRVLFFYYIMELRGYQNELLDQIKHDINFYDKICVQLSTGGGKTVIFTELIKQLDLQTLILVDSIDLLNQTVSTFSKKGIDIGALTAGGKFPTNKVVVAMVATLNNRVKKNTNLLNHIQLCVVDEAHVWIFNKIFPFIPNAKIIGFTATPCRLKRYKLDEDTTQLEVMADVYDHIIVGKSIDWLMNNGYLVRDENILIDFDSSGLKTDASGEFTAASLKEVFQKDEYQKALRKTYDIYAESKKTMIFTSATETNEIFAELFKDKNVKTYDSVNNNPNERDGIIEWFKNERDPILINTGCFTKGFDVCDVEVIIVARATMSLALWIQICGRGARITNKIDKPHILIIDGGNNIENHGIFSFERDWKKIFSDRKPKLIIEPQQECEYCGFTFPEKDKVCPNCGEIVPTKPIPEDMEKETKEFKINGEKAKLKPPTINIDFFMSKNVTDYEALKILSQKWIHFLVNQPITEENFMYHIRKGTFQEKFRLLLKPFYLMIIRSNLRKGKNVIYKNYCAKILEKAYCKKYNF